MSLVMFLPNKAGCPTSMDEFGSAQVPYGPDYFRFRVPPSNACKRSTGRLPGGFSVPSRGFGECAKGGEPRRETKHKLCQRTRAKPRINKTCLIPKFTARSQRGYSRLGLESGVKKTRNPDSTSGTRVPLNKGSCLKPPMNADARRCSAPLIGVNWRASAVPQPRRYVAPTIIIRRSACTRVINASCFTHLLPRHYTGP
jgi:hypothetical protein